MKYVIISGIIILVIFILILRTIPIGIEPLTEVYFENHTKLPVNIFLNRSYPFSFTVHNLEYRKMDYTFTINGEYNETGIIYNTGNFSLENNQSITLNETFLIPESFDRAIIKVLVTKDTNESIDIDFWVNQVYNARIYYENVSINSSSINNSIISSNLSGLNLSLNKNASN